MSNYIEYNDKIVFHPGYYIREMVDESGLTQEDFAKRLGTTPKNLSILIRGEQRLSNDLAAKLSRMLGTTISFWLNLQCRYDEAQTEILSESELQRERELFQTIDYAYFSENFALPAADSEKEQIQNVRQFLNISSLSVLAQKNLAINMSSRLQAYAERLNMVEANIMIQTAINQTLKKEMPKYNRQKFLKAIDFALTQRDNEDSFYHLIKDTFFEAGVFLIVIPALANAGICGAVKIVGGKMMLMISDRETDYDTFLFVLFREIGHILNGDYGFVFQADQDSDSATAYANEKLASVLL